MADAFQETNDALEHIEREMKYLNEYQVVIGFFADKESQLLEIVRANEYGALILPKKGKYLWVPSRYAIKKYGKSVKPRDIPHLFVPKNKRVACITENKKLVVCFYLLKQSRIPARAFIRKAFLDNQKKYKRYVHVGIDKICYENGTGKQLLTTLGKLGVSDIREEMRRWTKPSNAPLTIDNKKGVNNPLIDTGNLIKHVTWQILPIGEIK
ncbi:hypothetical protein [Lactobacillus helveticus]|uniref:hypothetical protein n=1 Tax=Lactobacillus helveticus TaxID=1587 RepID=UPI00062A9779|nr:hypothetical protein [Lactobacillus helveticus]AKG66646.1 hypothetical protein TU99_04830 [Lactobacillus helveticus]